MSGGQIRRILDVACAIAMSACVGYNIAVAQPLLAIFSVGLAILFYFRVAFNIPSGLEEAGG